MGWLLFILIIVIIPWSYSRLHAQKQTAKDSKTASKAAKLDETIDQDEEVIFFLGRNIASVGHTREAAEPMVSDYEFEALEEEMTDEEMDEDL